MWESIFAHIGEGCGRSAMILVAIAAGGGGAFLEDGPMQFGNVYHLLGDIRMTFQTAVGHGCAFPGRGMT